MRLQEKEKLYVELKGILARQPGPEVAEQLSIYQVRAGRGVAAPHGVGAGLRVRHQCGRTALAADARPALCSEIRSLHPRRACSLLTQPACATG